MNNLKIVLLIMGCFVMVNAASQESGLSEPDSTISLPEVVVNTYQREFGIRKA